MAKPAGAVLGDILSGLEQCSGGAGGENLFPAIKLSQCFPISSLDALQSTPAMRTLTSMWSDAGLDPRVGFNQGTGDISISIVIPAADQYRGDSRYWGAGEQGGGGGGGVF